MSDGKNGTETQPSVSPTEQKLQRGLGLHQSGALAEAANLYREILAIEPDHPDALHLLGLVLRQEGKTAEALTLVEQAIAHLPQQPLYHCSRGSILAGLARSTEALASYDHALHLKADYATAHHGRAQVLWGEKRIDDALASLDESIRLKPDFSDALNTRGVMLLELRRYSEALVDFDEAIRLKPDFSDPWNNRGIALKELSRTQDALASYTRAIELKPAYPEAFHNRGIALRELKQREEALAAYDEAIRLKPDYAAALHNRGLILHDLNRIEEALESYTQAITLEPENAQYRLYRLIGSLPIVPLSSEAATTTVGRFATLLEELENWVNGAPGRRNAIAREAGKTQPFYLAYRGGNHRELLSRYGDLVSDPSAATGAESAAETHSGRKLRLGVVSAHLRRHSVWDIVLKGILRHLDRSRFELLLYHLGSVFDDETRWAREQADGWRDADNRKTAHDWMTQIKGDRPDILFYPEVGMDPMTTALATHRLAPLQVVGWGHPITSGLPTLDCFLSGELLESPEAQSHYRERLIRLPGTGCCTEPLPLQAVPLVEFEAQLETLARPIFLIAQNPYKFDPAHDALFARIAREFDACTFLFVEFQEKGALLQPILQRIAEHFTGLGLDPSRYLRTIPKQTRGKFFTLLDRSDVLLDCPGFSGYTTAWQAVHRGLPIVTLEGEFLRQRLAAGLLRQIEAPDGIAATVEDYVQTAVRLGSQTLDSERFARRRAQLREAAAKADHRVDVVRAFEAALIDQVESRQSTLDEPLHRNPSPQTDPLRKTGFTHPWQGLDADIHLHSLQHDYAPVELLEMIAHPPREVLDIGCFCGGTGRWLKRRFPGAKLIGVEMLEAAAAIARPAYEEVHVGKLEQFDLDRWQGRFDAIIAADVLEHMYNPWGALQKLIPLLAPGGALYISLPNIRNLGVMTALAGGDWRYAASGILDITHIRFFTRAQTREMLEQTGWVIDDLKFKLDRKLVAAFPNQNLEEVRKISAGPLTLEVTSKEDALELLTLQFLVKASPGAPGNQSDQFS